jgi:hypothetical protein
LSSDSSCLPIKSPAFSSKFLPFYPSNFIYSLPDSCLFIQIPAFPSKFLHSLHDFHFLIQIPGFSSTFLPPHPASCIFVQINSICRVIVRMIRSFHLNHNFHAYSSLGGAGAHTSPPLTSKV